MRELKNHLSRYLRRVRGGEAVRVTMRGEHVADLVPPAAAAQDWRRELISAGRLTPAAKPHSEPPQPVDVGYSVSDWLLAEREEDER